MEFKLINKNLIIILTGGLFLISGFLWLTLGNTNALAYSDTTTHPDLTREIISFYELSTGKKFTDEQKQWVISGSIEEDRSPRWVNHFYDPVYERGLQAESIGISGYLAKNWAQYSSYQSVNPENIANLWTGKGPVISGSRWGDFSYEAAIKDYSKNKEKEAYLALGHVLHLIEDITVPEHTRNDAHPGGDVSSHYEIWTKNNSSGLTQDLGKKIFNQGYKPVTYPDLEDYFNNLATYTNNHFFSPRTINYKLYQKPKIVFEDGTFAYGLDENGQYFDLAMVETYNALTGKYTYNIKNTQILQEYWLRLSRQAVVNGTGVVQLFLDQAEAAKEAELAKIRVEENKNKLGISLLGRIINFFRSPEAPSSKPALVIKSELAKAPAKIILKPEAPVKPIEVKKPVTQTPAQPKPAPAPQSNPPIVYGDGGGGGGVGFSSNQVINNPSDSQETTQQTTNIAQQTNKSQSTTTLESFPPTADQPLAENVQMQTFQAGDLVINEIMYNLEGTDTNHEWIEIFNPKNNAVNLDGGKLYDGDGETNSGLNAPPKNGGQGSLIIPAGGYAILAAKADVFLADHQGFSGTVIDTVLDLKNSTDTIRLLAPDGTVFDEVTYSNSWGADGNGKTLERKSASGSSSDSTNWGISSANGGTPGAVNNWFIATTTSEIATSTLAMATSSEPILATGLGTDVPATTTITTDTVWTLAGSPYRLFFDVQRRPTVAAGATLTIAPGVKIIPQSGGATVLEVQGALNAVATSGAPIIFTSVNDADDSASTTPQKGDWLNIVFSQGSQVNMDYVEFRYGGGQEITLPLHEMVNIVGAIVSINHSKFENSKRTALHLMDSSGVVENSTFSDNDCGISVDSSNGIAHTSYGGCYGIHTTGQILSGTTLQIKNNQFIRNQNVGIEVRSGTAPIIDNNIFTDNGYPMKIESSYPNIANSQILNSTLSTSSGQATTTFLNGIAISGYTHFSQNYTLKKDLPYILETNGPALSPYVDSGFTLTLEPGTILKSNNTSPIIFVYGELIASTTPDSQIVFTSLKDDSKGGDTNGDGLVSAPQNRDWANIKFLTGAIGNFVNTVFSYGGFGYNGPEVSATSTAPFISRSLGAIVTVVVQ